MKIQISMSAVHEKEVFKFFNMTFLPGKAWQLMQVGKIKPKLIEFDIEPWAKQFLGLNRAKPDDKPMGLIRVNYDHMRSLSAERLEEPGMLVLTKLGGVLIDGQHRLAARYLRGSDSMQVYLFSEAQAKKHRIM